MLHHLLNYLYLYVTSDKTGEFLGQIEKIGLHLSPEDFLTKEPLFQALGVRSVGQQFKIACVNHNSGPAILIGHDKMQDLFLR